MKEHLKNIFKKKHKAGCLGKDSGSEVTQGSKSVFRKKEQVQGVQSASGRGAPEKQPGGQHGGGRRGTEREIRAERFQGEGSVHLRPRESSARN